VSALFIERIAGGTHGADDVLAAVGIERFPQAPDMDIDGAVIDVNIVPPDRIEQLPARVHPPGIFRSLVSCCLGPVASL